MDETGHFIPGEISAEGTLRAAAGESSVEIPIRIWTGVPFADVPASHPLFDAVKYVYDNGIFKGTSDTAFEPETVMDRAMLVTVLWRLEGSPEPETAAAFEDVAPETWYGKAVAWAAQQGIVKGYSDTLFAPTDALTREQVFAILHRWAGLPEAEETADVPEDTDDWALASLQWAVGAGVFRKRSGLRRGAVGGIDVHLTGDAQRVQHLLGFFHNGQVAGAAHDDSDFFHPNLLR